MGGETQRALAVRETRRLVRERAVAHEEVVDGGLDAAVREQLRKAVVPHVRDGGARPGRAPRAVGRELLLDGGPVGARDGFDARHAQNGPCGLVRERLEPFGPEGVHARRERQDGRGVLGDERQVGGRREVGVDLRRDGLVGGVGGRRRFAEDGDLRAGGLPGEMGPRVGEEAVGRRLVDAVVARAVPRRALACGDLRNHGGKRRVGGRFRGDDAIAVERLGVEEGRRAQHVRKGDRRRVGAVLAGEDAREGREQGLALLRRRVHVGEGHLGLACEEDVEAAEARTQPGDGGEHVGRADAPVAVRVEEAQGRRVETQSLRGGGKDRPEPLVQLGERREVGPGLQLHLHAAGGLEEPPSVRCRIPSRHAITAFIFASPVFRVSSGVVVQ